MSNSNDKKEVILILPYLNVNTTSAERFKSFINALRKNPVISSKVIEIIYPIKKSYFSGMELNTEDFSVNNYIKIKPHFNLIQSLGFWFLNCGLKKIWRLFQLLHLVLFKKDIFYPGDLLLDSSCKNGIVIVSGSHFSYFNTAVSLSKKLGFKLVIDYRDPWTLGYPAIGGKTFVHNIKTLISRKDEIKFLQQADLITTVSSSLKSFFPDKYSNKVMILENGSNFNQEDVDLNYIPKKFNILYAGTIYTSQLNNHLFFKAFKTFIANKDHSKIQLQFIGSLNNKGLLHLIKKYKLNAVTLITKRLNSEDMKKYFNQASVFLHLKYGENRQIISSKQADYLSFRRPILLPISDQGDLAQSIIQNHAGYVCTDETSILNALEDIWEKFENGENFYIEQDSSFIRRISREAIANDFVQKLLDL